MMKRWAVALILASAIGVVSPGSALAQAKKGDKELLTFTTVTSVLGTGHTNLNGTIFLNIGSFVSDTFEIGGGPTVSLGVNETPGQYTYNPKTGQIVQGEGSWDISADAGVNVFARKFFRTSNPKVQPYVGAEYFIQSLKSASDSQFVNGLAGVKDYLNQRTAIDAKFSFGFAPQDPGGIQLIMFTIGLSYNF
jgi:hypothetical protein